MTMILISSLPDANHMCYSYGKLIGALMFFISAEYQDHCNSI